MTRYITRTYKTDDERKRIINTQENSGYVMVHDDFVYKEVPGTFGVDQVFESGKLSFDTQPELEKVNPDPDLVYLGEYATLTNNSDRINYIAKFLGLSREL